MHSIKNILLKQSDGYNTFSADFLDNDKNSCENIWFKTPHKINAVRDIFLVSTLIPCMKMNSDLNIDGSIDFELLTSLRLIQAKFNNWFKDLNIINVKNASFNNSIQYDISQKSVACFFTGGVDSFYTLLKNNNEITKIVYVHGFDIWLQEKEFRQMVSKRLHELAHELGKELIEVETNLLDFSYKICDWEKHYHGAALASIALLLSKTIRKIYIPSSFSYESLIPWGTHPELDYLWSTEEIEIVHDGCELNRLEKVRYISKYQSVMDHLRVCLDRSSGKYNCSRCEKCIRTMTSLYICGTLSLSKSFDNYLTPDMISNMDISKSYLKVFSKENYDQLMEGDIKEALKNKI